MMERFSGDLPPTLAKITGHIWGVMFISLSSLALWMMYKISRNPSFGGAFLFLCTSAIAYFFARTAFKLNGHSNNSIFSQRALKLILLTAPILGLLVMVFSMQQYLADEISFMELIVTSLLVSASGIFSLMWLQHMKRNHRR
jgi:hypothetical protein